MGFFTRRSRFDELLGVATAMAAGATVRRAAKVGAGVAAGLVGATAVSAAVSAAREQEHR